MAKAKPRRQTMSTLGSRIRDVLEQKGMSQAELARLVGVKQQTIHYLCHPKSAGQIPMNDDFPSVRSDNTDIKILGTVVEHRRYRK